ncbi:uncharacterized protein F4812DRAFT_306549 [Daldinia caldariorum]|uniref:uncharacterized protein n=1 Tax=Daldinia caldariorum TaxID=326644 RepID=UPI00200899AC|nr:uncharacterized protein F4812DRAFT_306549 [Daldinia caldariorum]KAI1469910.1 hypothetical protein F4812DRAFT_306549 [Daldinia caldariorum]
MSIVYARLSIIGSSNDPATPATDRIETDVVPLTTEGSRIIASGIILILLVALCTGLRFWSLRRSGRAFMVDDGLYLGAVIIFYGLVATGFSMVLAGGAGHHVGELQDWHLVRLLKAIYAGQFLYAISLGLMKFSAILMLIRIFFDRRFKLAAIATMVFTVAWIILSILIEFLICRPAEINWQIRTAGTCGDQKAAFAAISLINVINQLMILALPLPMILKLQMEWRYKIVTICIFSIGILTLLFGALHLSALVHIDYSDIPYTIVQASLYGTCEAGIAIIISSFPLLRPVFETVFSMRLSRNTGWESKGTILTLSKTHKSTKSSGFTRMASESREELELGNMGAHRAKRDTYITAGKRPTFRDDDDNSSLQKIVVTSETIVSRVKGEL